MRRLFLLTACLALFALLLAGLQIGAANKQTRWAYVDNQTNDSLALAYDENIDGQTAKSRSVVYAGQMIRLDTTKLTGEVCAWRTPDLKPAEKIACRTLRPGDHWVVY